MQEKHGILHAVRHSAPINVYIRLQYLYRIQEQTDDALNRSPYGH
jgi:hypothetical protein